MRASNSHVESSDFALRQSLTRSLTSPFTLATLVLVGVLIRGAVYLAHRSLTLDEAFIALNIDRRSSGQLTGVLDWNSAAPIGFLELEKLLTNLFGKSDLVFRAAPLAASVGALVLFANVAVRVTGHYVAPLALALFAGLALAISYAALTKPYSLDVFFVLALSLSSLAVLRDRGNPLPIVVLAALGAIAPLFSYASVFAIAASATVLALNAFVEKNRSTWSQTGFLLFTWTTLLVVLVITRHSTLSHLRRSFRGEGIGSLDSFRTGGGALREVLGVSSSSSGLGYIATAAAVCAGSLIIVGVVHLVRRQWEMAGLLVLPAVFVTLASAAGWYPVVPRALLFLGPILAIFIAQGFSVLFVSTRALLVRAAVIVIIGIVVIVEGAATGRVISAVRPDDGIKPIMTELAATERRTDRVYLSFASQYPFAHYLECRCFTTHIPRARRTRLWDVVPIPGRVDQWSPALKPTSDLFIIGKFRSYGLQGYYHDFVRFPTGSRVWVILSFLHADERRLLVAHLNRLGRRLKSYGGGSGVDAVTAYLYAF